MICTFNPWSDHIFKWLVWSTRTESRHIFLDVWVWYSYSHFHKTSALSHITKKNRILFKNGWIVGPQNQRFWLKRGVFFVQSSRKKGCFTLLRKSMVYALVGSGVGWSAWGEVGWVEGGRYGGRMRMVRMTYDFPFDITCGFDLNTEDQIRNIHIVKMHLIGPFT